MVKSNIIDINSRPVSTEQPVETTDQASEQQGPTPLSVNDIHNMQVAMHKIKKLRSQSVVTPNLESEITGLTQFIVKTFLQHADEFVGTWIVMNTEYEPLLQGVRRMFSRIEDINASERAARARAVSEHLKQSEADSKATGSEGDKK